MNRDQRKLDRLLTLARKAPRPREPDFPIPAPFGLAGRIAAQWAARAEPHDGAEAWERLCWWGAGTAAAVCLLTVVYQRQLPEPTVFDLLIEAPLETAPLR